MIINIIYAIFSYLLGNILGGKLVGSYYKVDLDKEGSKNIGARNAGRILGAKAFLFVGIVDFFKGFLVVMLLKIFNVNIVVITICMLLVVLGHIKPIIFKFDGGKGVATFMGAIAAMSPNLLFVLILGVLLIGFITKSTTIGFYSTLPVLTCIYYLEYSSVKGTIVFLLLILLLTVVSLSNIRNSFNKYFYPKRRKVIKK